MLKNGGGSNFDFLNYISIVVAMKNDQPTNYLLLKKYVKHNFPWINDWIHKKRYYYFLPLKEKSGNNASLLRLFEHILPIATISAFIQVAAAHGNKVLDGHELYVPDAE